jgi:hypothetical protein
LKYFALLKYLFVPLRSARPGLEYIVFTISWAMIISTAYLVGVYRHWPDENGDFEIRVETGKIVPDVKPGRQFFLTATDRIPMDCIIGYLGKSGHCGRDYVAPANSTVTAEFMKLPTFWFTPWVLKKLVVDGSVIVDARKATLVKNWRSSVLPELVFVNLFFIGICTATRSFYRIYKSIFKRGK